MKNLYLIILSLLINSLGIFAQSSWLTPEESYKITDIFTDKAFSCHDIIGDSLYAMDSEGLYSYDLNTLEQKCNYGKAPADYNAWVSFLTADPNGKRIWVGYTSSGLVDDRIYSIDITTHVWTHRATFPGNFDMEINDGKYYVSGLNTEGWDGVNDINCISLLDTTGADVHKKLIEIGGNSSGLAVDKSGNIYNAKYDPNGSETYMYKWVADSVQKVIDAAYSSFLPKSSGILITSMPTNGPYDCDVDDVGNLIFNCNDFVGGSFVALWDGNTGNAHNYKKMGIYGGSSFAWFSMLKAKGDITKDGKAYMLNFGDPIAEIHLSAPPEITKSLGIISGYTTDTKKAIDLTGYFHDSDDIKGFTYEVTSNSLDSVASSVIVDDTLLVIDFQKIGQTNIYVKATSNGQSVINKLIVGVQQQKTDNYTVSDFEDLTLADDSYWNGADGSGGFIDGLSNFSNTYNAAWKTWSGWAYTNLSDNETAGYTNPYSAITGAGFDTVASNGGNYGVTFVAIDVITQELKPSPITFADSSAHNVKGFYITNSTYAALSIIHGDPFAKKFGGADGNDPDYFKVNIWGMKDGAETDTIEYYLADFRFEDNTKDYVVQTWQWVELSTLGKVDTLLFSLSSSDVGMFGINTPLYFNVDNICVLPDAAPIVANPITNIEVAKNASDSTISLLNVFTDTDDEDTNITKSVKSNSNNTLVSVSISNDEITLSYTAETIGEAEIVIEAKSNGKTVTDTIIVTVTTVSNLENTSFSDIVLYPNPSNGVFKLKTNEASTFGVRIYSLQGSLIYANDNDSNTMDIDISSQPAGQYIIKLNQGSSVSTKLFVIQ